MQTDNLSGAVHEQSRIQKPPLKLIVILFLVVVFFVGVFIFKFINKPFDFAQDETEKKLSYIYDDINQVVGNVEIAKQMTEGTVTPDATRQEVKGINRGIMMSGDYKYMGLLADVIGSTTAGLAKANFEDNQYSFYSTLANLMEPINGDYYEGWLVKKEPFGFVSTGKIEKIGGEYINLYKSNMDLRDYNLYVVTMEENDGNSAPAKHILEGVLKK